MKRRTFFKACAGALAGVAGWAGYKTATRDIGGTVARKGMEYPIHSMKIVAPQGQIWIWDDVTNTYVVIDEQWKVGAEFTRLQREGFFMTLEDFGRPTAFFSHKDHTPRVAYKIDDNWTYPQKITFV